MYSTSDITWRRVTWHAPCVCCFPSCLLAASRVFSELSTPTLSRQEAANGHCSMLMITKPAKLYFKQNKTLQKKHQDRHPPACNVYTFSHDICHKTMMVELYPSLLSGCPVLGRQRPLGTCRQRGWVREGEVKGQNVSLMSVCFSVLSVHNYEIQQGNYLFIAPLRTLVFWCKTPFFPARF